MKHPERSILKERVSKREPRNGVPVGSQVRLGRAALYRAVWSKSVKTSARDLGLCYLTIRRACQRMDIPLPARHQGLKVRWGLPVVRPKLPPASPSVPSVLVVRSDGRAAPPIELDADLKTGLLGMLATIEQPAVPSRLKRPHPIIAAWLINDRRWKAEAKETNHQGRYVPIDGTRAQRRRLNLLDAICKLLEGNRFELHGIGWRIIATSRKLGSQPVTFEVRERLSMTLVPLTEIERKRLTRFPNQRYKQRRRPSGDLIFAIRGFKAPGFRHYWEEGPHLRLETEVIKLVASIMRHAATMEQLRRDRFTTTAPPGRERRGRVVAPRDFKWKR